MPDYIPGRGDFVSLSFDPQSGHEQKGRRPGLVLTSQAFNRTTGMAVICPVTNTNRNWPFHVPIVKSPNLTGVVMVDQLKSLDFGARHIKFIERASVQTIEDVMALADSILFQ